MGICWASLICLTGLENPQKIYFFRLRASERASESECDLKEGRDLKLQSRENVKSVDLSPSNLSRLSSQSREVRDYDTHYELKISAV